MPPGAEFVGWICASVDVNMEEAGGDDAAADDSGGADDAGAEEKTSIDD